MAQYGPAGADDVSDTLSPEEVADRLRAVIAAMGGDVGSGTGLPAGGEPGQALVMGTAGPEWQFISGVPLGQLTFLPYDDAPPGFVKLSYDTETMVSLEAFPDASVMACPAGFNDEADFFYRAESLNGQVRSAGGQYLVLPAASRYFFRAYDPDGGAGQYCYQDWAIENIVGNIPNVYMSGLVGTGSGALFKETSSSAGIGGSTLSDRGGQLTFDASRVVKTADETRPMTIAAFRVFMKLWDAAVAPAQLDVQALVNHWSELSAHCPDLYYLHARCLGAGMAGEAPARWHDVRDERAINTTYTNTTGRPILWALKGGVSHKFNTHVDEHVFYGGLTVQLAQRDYFLMYVPAGSTYGVETTAVALGGWLELF